MMDTLTVEELSAFIPRLLANVKVRNQGARLCNFQEIMTDPPTDMRVYISTRQNYREGHNNGNKKIKLLVLNTLKPLV